MSGGRDGRKSKQKKHLQVCRRENVKHTNRAQNIYLAFIAKPRIPGYLPEKFFHNVFVICQKWRFVGVVSNAAHWALYEFGKDAVDQLRSCSYGLISKIVDFHFVLATATGIPTPYAALQTILRPKRVDKFMH